MAGVLFITVGALIGGVFLVYMLVPMILAIVLIVLVTRDTFRHQAD